MAAKSRPVEVKPRPFIGCGYETCQREAVCRVWTKTGWLNVCLSHYQTTPVASRRSESDTVREIREAYQARLAAKETPPPAFDELEEKLLDAAQV